MTEIRYGAYIHSKKQSACLRSILDQFEAQTGIKVRLDALDIPIREIARSKYAQNAIYRQIPDLTDIGSTWVNDMVVMDALRPFSAAEVEHIAPATDFPPASWQSCRLQDDPQQWAIPWTCHLALINYRPDLLARAGVDERTAFQSLEALTQAAEQLRLAGIDVPVEIAYHQRDRFTMMHAMAGWVWSNGEEFIREDGKQVVFDRPTVIDTICAYFGLLRHISLRGCQWLRESQSDLFRQGKAAISFQCYALNKFRDDSDHTTPEVESQWRAIPYPKVSWLGGQNLIVWKNVFYEKEVIELVRFLSSVPVQVQLATELGNIPARLSALEDASLQQDPMIRVVSEAVRRARSYHNVPLWGLVEDRLLNALTQIEEAVLKDPAVDLHGLAHNLLDEQAYRLNITLSHLPAKSPGENWLSF